jgi:hypothetical protein
MNRSLSCEQGQKPLSLLLTGGQRGDSPQFVPVLHRIRALRGHRCHRCHQRMDMTPVPPPGIMNAHEHVER